jgi:hypothetical protein
MKRKILVKLLLTIALTVGYMSLPTVKGIQAQQNCFARVCPPGTIRAGACAVVGGVCTGVITCTSLSTGSIVTNPCRPL